MKFYDMIDGIITEIRRREDPDWFRVTGPVSISNIAKIETRLNLKFPAPLMEYLSRYGSISSGNSHLHGIFEDDPDDCGGGTLLFHTLEARKLYNLPMKYVVIEEDTFMWMVVLDTETGVVHEYHTSNEKIVATIEKSFNEFLMRFLYIAFPREGWAETLNALGINESQKLLYLNKWQ
ncbi:MAG: SMI1/KNR4 family protein [Pseudobdellovibrionaceae bacterium]|nr:SMI1/KNR4 family protein [Pseudobdellovibrionaceae bacterium]